MTDQIKRLYRSQTDKMIFGVCGGLGEYFVMDSTIFRALFVILAFFNGIGIFLYILMAIIVPIKPSVNSTRQEKSNVEQIADEAGKKIEEVTGEIKQKSEGEPGKKNMLGFVVVVLGLVLLAGQYFPQYLRWMTWQTVGSLLLIYIGVYLISKK